MCWWALLLPNQQQVLEKFWGFAYLWNSFFTWHAAKALQTVSVRPVLHFSIPLQFWGPIFFFFWITTYIKYVLITGKIRVKWMAFWEICFYRKALVLFNLVKGWEEIYGCNCKIWIIVNFFLFLSWGHSYSFLEWI